jgi:hypothetical protein
MNRAILQRIPEPIGLRDLSKRDQIRYVQALWEEVIGPEPSKLAAPPSHVRLVLDRLEAHRADPSRARPAGEIIKRLAGKKS